MTLKDKVAKLEIENEELEKQLAKITFDLKVERDEICPNCKKVESYITPSGEDLDFCKTCYLKTNKISTIEDYAIIFKYRSNDEKEEFFLPEGDFVYYSGGEGCFIPCLAEIKEVLDKLDEDEMLYNIPIPVKIDNYKNLPKECIIETAKKMLEDPNIRNQFLASKLK